MTDGPPTSQAGPSQTPTTASSTSETVLPKQLYYNTVQSNAQAGPSQPSQQHTQHSQALLAQQAQSQAQTQGQQNAAQAYYMGYPPGTWQNAWQLSGYPYATSGSPTYQQTHYTQLPYTQYQQYQPQLAARQRKPPLKPRTPTPEPVYRHWDEVIRAFLKKVGLTQALRGFEDDMVVLNADWERKSVPGAIGDLVRDLMVRRTRSFPVASLIYMFVSVGQMLGKFKEGEEPKERPLEERKLDCIHLSTGAEPQSQSTVSPKVSLSHHIIHQTPVQRSRSLSQNSLLKIVQRMTRQIAPSFSTRWHRNDGGSTSIPRVPNIFHRARGRMRNPSTETFK